jgi:membrane-bound ClpP family serine protease
MIAIVTLFLVGALLLALEAFVPGVVVGILGGIAILAGVVTAFGTYGAGGGMIALVAGAALIGVTLYLEFVVLPKTRFAKALSMTETVGGTSQKPIAALDEVMNEAGETATALAPSGYVVIKGRRYEAFSQSGFLPKGAGVRVTGLDNFRLIVTKT